MSDTFTLPPLVVNYDTRWISVDLHGDLGVWAKKSAQDVLARWGLRGGRREKALTRQLEQAGTIARRVQDSSLAYLLYPELGGKFITMFRVMPIDIRGHDQDSAWNAMLGWLVPPAASGLHPEITDLATPAGACKRIRVEQPLGDGTVAEQLAYTWIFPQYGSGVVLTGSFTDLEQAAQWRPAADELADSVTLDEAAK